MGEVPAGLGVADQIKSFHDIEVSCFLIVLYLDSSIE
jgi:hypothetical protein